MVWLGGPMPDMRLEAHYGDRVVPCFVERPPGLHALLTDAAARNPHGEALVDGATRLTWAQLLDRTAALMTGLQRRGIEPGDRVALLVGNRAEFVLALFAVARLGAISVPLGIRLQPAEIAHALNDCGAVLVFCDSDLIERLPAEAEVPALRHRVVVGGTAAPHRFEDLLVDGATAPAPADSGEDDTAVILYTSGTTGRPKGAMLTNLSIVHSAMVYEYCMGLTAGDRSLVAVPLSHVTGLIASIATMARCAGALIILPAFKAADFLALAAAERMTNTVMVPAMYKLCLLQPDFARHDLSGWRIGAYGGALMAPDTIAKLAAALPGLQLMNAYGATETTSPVTLMPPVFTAAHADSVGRPVPGATVTVVDDQGRALPPGEVGEIWLHGAMVVHGYWNNAAATAEGFTAGYWHSGDLGSIDADGFVRVLDRKKDMINRGGFKIYSAEVENVLVASPDVVECAVVGTPCPVLGERVHAFIVPRRAGVAAEAIRAYCATLLADYKVPETITLSTEPLPRNANGKVLKRLLRERLQAQGAGGG